MKPNDRDWPRWWILDAFGGGNPKYPDVVDRAATFGDREHAKYIADAILEASCDFVELRPATSSREDVALIAAEFATWEPEPELAPIASNTEATRPTT